MATQTRSNERSTMRLSVFAAAVSGVLALAPLSASAEEKITEDGLARLASLFVAIQEECPEYYAIDKSMTRKFIEASQTAGVEAYGPGFKNTLTRELKRRGVEVDATGAYYWCMYQRGYQHSLSGDKSMFKE